MKAAFTLLALPCLLTGACDAPKQDAALIPVASPAEVATVGAVPTTSEPPRSEPVAPSRTSAPCERPELSCSLPAGVRCTEIRLRASGYYVPGA